ncbi:MAG: hypothetical protein ACK4NZ_16715 [Tsuneonella sp.]
MEQALLALLSGLESLGLVDWAKGSVHVYPWANVVHVIGVVLLVGGIGIVDLRIIGVWRRLPLSALSHALTPVAIAGLLLQAASGMVLFAADGKTLAASSVFHAKLVFVALAVLNAAVFRLRWNIRTDSTSFAQRSSAATSLALWVAVAVLGRLIAYY